MITEKQLKIFKAFVRNPFREYTRGEIKKASKEKSNNALARTINALKEEQVLIEKKVGKSGLLSLNMQNEMTFQYLAICNTNVPHLVKLSIERIITEITEITPFYALAIFGSYAIGAEKKESDLDVAIFIDEETLRKRIEAALHSAKLKSPLDLDVHVIPRKEMIEMLTNKEENLGKQIARKNLAIYNHRIFYEIIMEGMNHGFRI
jgi:predicted nucleotidyltransferase